MHFIDSIERLVPAVLGRAVRNYLDDRAWLRLQPQLPFDSTNLRSVSDAELASAMRDPAISAAFAEDHGRIEAVFGAGEIAGAVNPGDRRALYHLVGYFKPCRVLEIGTHVGASTVHIASALRRFVGQGTLCTADIVDAVTLEDAKKVAKQLWGQGLLTVIVGRAPQAAAQPATAAAPLPKAN